MKTNEEITGLVRATFADRRVAFRPCAVFDDRLDCIRIVTRDCSVTETRVSDLITILEPNHPREGRKKCVGFTVKGARHFCNKYGLDMSAPVRMSALLDALMRSAPSLVVEAVIQNIVRPLVEEEKIEQVEPIPTYSSLPQQAY